MPMSRAKKEEEIVDYKNRFADNDVFVVAQYTGMTVAEMTDLRGKIGEQGASIKVTKNRLAKIALAGTEIAGLSDFLAGPVALAASNDPSVAKVIFEYAKKNSKLVIVGGAIGAKVLDKAGVEQLAKLPSLDQLRGQLVGLLVTPARQIMGVVSAPAGGLARVIAAHAAKGE